MASRFVQPRWNYGEVPHQQQEEPEFYAEVRRLGLQEYEFPSSNALRLWVKKHRNTNYVPEWLLKHWNMRLTIELSGE